MQTSGNYGASITTLSENKVLIAYNYGQSGSGYEYRLYGMVCEINGTTITARNK